MKCMLVLRKSLLTYKFILYKYFCIIFFIKMKGNGRKEEHSISKRKPSKLPNPNFGSALSSSVPTCYCQAQPSFSSAKLKLSLVLFSVSYNHPSTRKSIWHAKFAWYWLETQSKIVRHVVLILLGWITFITMSMDSGTNQTIANTIERWQFGWLELVVLKFKIN